MSEVLEAAREYVRRGWHVVRVGQITTHWSEKHEAWKKDIGSVEKWQHYQDSPRSLDDVERDFAEWRWNIGLVTGPVSGLFVVDIDGPDGAATMERLTAEHGQIETYTVATRSGGWHLYFQHPGERWPEDIKGTRARSLPGIDTRGDGGLVFAPPTRVDAPEDEGGGYYAAYDTRGLAELPQWFIDAVVEHKAAATRERKRLAGQKRATVARQAKPVAVVSPATAATLETVRAKYVAAQPGELHEAAKEIGTTLGGLVAAGRMSQAQAHEEFRDVFQRGNSDDWAAQSKTFVDCFENGLKMPMAEETRPDFESVRQAVAKPEAMAAPDFQWPDMKDFEAYTGFLDGYALIGERWHRWTGTHYAYLTTADMKRELRRLANDWRGQVKESGRWVVEAIQPTRWWIDELLSALEAKVPVLEPTAAVAYRDGLLVDGGFLPYGPEVGVTRFVDASVADAGESRMVQVLQDVHTDSATVLRQIAYAVVTGTYGKHWFALEGKRDRAKTTFVNYVAAALGAPDGIGVGESVASVTGRFFGQKISGNVVLAFEEAQFSRGSTGAAEVAALKAFNASTWTYEEKNGGMKSMPGLPIFLMTNNPLVVKDASGAAADRIVKVLLTEPVPKTYRIFTGYLEADEVAAFVKWVLECPPFDEFQMSEDAKATLRRDRDDADRGAAFARDMLVEDRSSAGQIPNADMKRAWLEYVGEQDTDLVGRMPVALVTGVKSTYSLVLNNQQMRDEDGNKCRGWVGIRLKTPRELALEAPRLAVQEPMFDMET